LTEVDQTLLVFGQTRRTALRRYRAGFSGGFSLQKLEASASDVNDEGVAEEELWYDVRMPYVDELGRSTAIERPEVSTDDFVMAACDFLDIRHELVAGRSRKRQVARARRMVVLLGVERWGKRGSSFTKTLARTPDVISWMVGRAVKDRLEDESFRATMDELDVWLTESLRDAAGSGMNGKRNPGGSEPHR